MSLSSSSATFSECGKYRYRLERVWDCTLRKAIVIMLNPSIADAERDDPTIRKLKAILSHNDYGGMMIFNLWPIVSTDPSILKKIPHAVAHLGNEPWMESIKESNYPVIFAWGVPGGSGNISTDKFAERAFCFGQNKDGSPKHPLYLKNETKIRPFKV